MAAAPLTALLLGLVVALSGARGSDWPAHLFRIELFRDVGLTLWNGQWYGGHYTLGYSVIYPPLASWFGPMVVGIASSVVAAAAFAALLHRYFGLAGATAACWFAVGTAVNLAVGRLPFALGLAFGLVALLAYERGWTAVGLVAAPLTSLSSPVAGVFLGIALCGIVIDLWLRRRNGQPTALRVPIAMAGLTIAPVVIASALFPDPGVFPFRGAAFAGVMASCIGLVIVLPPTARVLRVSAAITAVASVPLFVFANPLGGNMTRIVAFFVLPILAAAMWSRRRPLVIAAGIPLALWMVLPGVASADHIGDQAAEASYHDPVIDLVTTAGGAPGRVEIPFTAGHWEVAFVAAEVPIARGWERQVDMDRNEILYEPELTLADYRRWIDDHAVRWIALPDVELDAGGKAEAALLEGDVPWLRLARTTDHWRIWEVVDAAPIVAEPGRLVTESPDEIVIAVDEPGTVLVRAWYMPYWSAVEETACIKPSDDGLLEVVVTAPGLVHLRPQFSLEPLLSDQSPDECLEGLTPPAGRRRGAPL
ncbi:MAG: hypothetical protein ABWZ99_02770 [Ilumatobacteraceae bacterium]